MNNTTKNKSGFFEDENGNKSSTRLKTFLAAIVTLIISLVDVFSSSFISTESLPLIITLLAFSAGEKSYQYFLEFKSKKS